MESTPLRVGRGIFLKMFFENFRSHIKDSKWGRKCIFINCTSCNGSPQQIPFQFANGKLPHSRCRAFWALNPPAKSKIPTIQVPKFGGSYRIGPKQQIKSLKNSQSSGRTFLKVIKLRKVIFSSKNVV